MLENLYHVNRGPRSYLNVVHVCPTWRINELKFRRLTECRCKGSRRTYKFRDNLVDLQARRLETWLALSELLATLNLINNRRATIHLGLQLHPWPRIHLLLWVIDSCEVRGSLLSRERPLEISVTNKWKRLVQPKSSRELCFGHLNPWT